MSSLGVPAYSAASVRAAEAHLLAQQQYPDELMILAATAVAQVARRLLTAHQVRPDAKHPVVILAGPGGNGGDGLYAGAQLARQGWPVVAYLLSSRCHERARQAVVDAGGVIISSLPPQAGLIIDAIAGLGSGRPLHLELPPAPAILAVDMPTGVAADSGEVAPGAIVATATITFGAARAGQLFAPECGDIFIADLQLPTAPAMSTVLAGYPTAGHYLGEYPRTRGYESPAGPEPVAVSLAGGISSYGGIAPTEPGIRDHKYSTGVSALCAGSQRYPGAGVLCTTAALRASSGAVKVIGHPYPGTITALAEALFIPQLDQVGTVHCWAVGPGRGTDQAAAAELAWVLRRHHEAVVIDADALSVTAQDPHLRQAVSEHPAVVLTPHWGEFERLYRGSFPDEADQPVPPVATALPRLARQLRSFIVLKGRLSILADPDGQLVALNAGHSFAATAGSGDVLSGITAALVAQYRARAQARGTTAGVTMAGLQREIIRALAVHQYAAAAAARHGDAVAPCTAMQIATAIGPALAQLGSA